MNNVAYQAPRAKPADKRLFALLVLLSFPVFFLVAIERRMASSINKDIVENHKGIITDAKEYATSTIAQAFQSQ
jgi:hypothetical protein